MKEREREQKRESERERRVGGREDIHWQKKSERIINREVKN